MAASLLLFISFVLILVDAEEKEESDTKRFNFENPFMQNKFYTPFMPMPPSDGLFPSNLPVLSKIIPINVQNQQVGPSVTGHVYASEVPSHFLPNFIMPCRKETASATKDENLEPMIMELMTNLENLAKKVQVLAELFALQSKLQAVGAFESDNHENPETSSTIKKIGSTTPETIEIEEPADESTTKANVNTQSDVFQCEGVTCPKTTVSCKVVEQSVEPTHEKLVKTVFCFNKQGSTIKQVEKKVVNPNKGYSMSSSRTHDSSSGPTNPKQKEKFDSEMKNFDIQMNSAFRNF